jgi:hypothetical protein
MSTLEQQCGSAAPSIKNYGTDEVLEALRPIVEDLGNYSLYSDFAKKYPAVYSELSEQFYEVMITDLGVESARSLGFK